MRSRYYWILGRLASLRCLMLSIRLVMYFSISLRFLSPPRGMVSKLSFTSFASRNKSADSGDAARSMRGLLAPYMFASFSRRETRSLSVACVSFQQGSTHHHGVRLGGLVAGRGYFPTHSLDLGYDIRILVYRRGSYFKSIGECPGDVLFGPLLLIVLSLEGKARIQAGKSLV